LVVLSAALPAHKQFIQFMEYHNKQYKSDEEFTFRLGVFQENLKKYDEWNSNSTPGSAWFGVTKFSDLTDAEFAELYLMKDLPPYTPNAPQLEVDMSIKAPTTFDWRTQGACTPIKDQGQCGSCWAFSATENIESVWKLKGNTLPVLGPQQIVDCDKDCYGCGGGWPYRAVNYVKTAGGQDSEVSYPYHARNQQCAFKPASVLAKVTGYKTIAKDENQIQTALTTTSPFSICVDASRWSSYRGGIMMASQCSHNTDHCVQLVGYDTTGATPFWIVRNSWGTSWGESGIIRLQMFKDTCAMADNVITATA
jgi:C1A family cysteine protease